MDRLTVPNTIEMRVRITQLAKIRNAEGNLEPQNPKYASDWSRIAMVLFDMTPWPLQ